ncbi:MAG: hypothetical protein QNJ85_11570 [Gammaproteobacteria bacterium]|nr:hypothetical protein [Gammaproteobacteria bacterium]
MPSKCLICLLLAALGTTGVARAADLMTLFTTPEERQIINANRYKSDEPRPAPVEEVVEETTLAPDIQQLVLEQVRREYRVSGITISRDGLHTVWINSAIYQDGEQLDSSSRIKVFDGDEVRVRITAPDGKHYFARSGETVEVSYMAPVEN